MSSRQRLRMKISAISLMDSLIGAAFHDRSLLQAKEMSS